MGSGGGGVKRRLQGVSSPKLPQEGREAAPGPGPGLGAAEEASLLGYSQLRLGPGSCLAAARPGPGM